MGKQCIFLSTSIAIKVAYVIDEAQFHSFGLWAKAAGNTFYRITIKA